MFRILIRGLAPASHKEHVQNTHIAERHHAPAVHLVIGSAAASSVHNGGDSAWKGGRVRIYTVFCTMVKIMNMVINQSSCDDTTRSIHHLTVS